ncbi:MAG: error-prone DNA polymerase [Labilithrix sp.]|nr:error-prone DNA polymerase [Labilithrix sp.]
MPELLELRRTIEARPSRYVELTARTSFSFLSGATPPEKLVERAAELGYDAIAIADRDGLYGIVRAHEEGQKQGVRVIVGCELTLEEEGLSVPPIPGKPTTLTVLVENHVGYTNLCKILTESHRRHPKSRPTQRTNDLDEDELPRNTFAGVPLAYVCAHAEGLWAIADATLPVADLHRAFGGRLSIAVHLHKDGEDRARVVRSENAARTHGVPIVATGRVLFAKPEDKPIFDVLHCIREGKTLDEAGRDLLPNAEAHLKGDEEIGRLFSLHPEWIARSRAVADRCRFSITELSYRFPYEITDLVHRDFHGNVGETADEALRRLTEQGACLRYGSPDAVPEKVRAQIEKELALITKLEVAPYFLSVRAIVDMARRRDILCQGRGSAANSAVCFCLGITAVDPARSNMLFERFLSAERREPPDIDVDFEHERREEIIQEIYETYGRDRAAMVCEVVSYRAKSALREVGKVFGFSLEQVDRLAGVVTWWDGVSAVSESRLRAIGLSATDPRVRQTVALTRAIQGFPRHLSIHVGGFILSAAPLEAVAPVEPATMEGRTIVPWDKDDIDTLGFFKIDVLGLGMLTAIRKCLDLVRDAAARDPNHVASAPALAKGTAIERLASIPAEDPAVYDALCKADTVGVFQIESRAQMAMLPRLRPRCFYDLVIEVAIVRPGPIQGGMVHPYLRRRSGEEKHDPPHPILRPILERTLGVPLFQEQVMQIAIVGAGYSGGEADRLRRDMAAWRKTGSLEKHRDRLIRGFRERGIPEDFGERLYQQIHGFAEYGFPESHSASFSLLVYASSWLKVYYPAEFAAALVNSQPMGFYSPSTILQDAQRHGVELLPIDVALSGWDCACDENQMRLGLRLVSGLGEETGRRIERARAEAPFGSIEDLAARARLHRKELVALAESGALDGLSGGRREAIWKVVAPRPDGMYEGMDRDEARPKLKKMSRAEQLVLDYERTGVSIADHPMKLVRAHLPKKTRSSRDLLALKSGTRVSVAGLVICRQRPGTASGVVFVTMEDEFGFSNLVLWSKFFEENRHVATTSRLMMVHGKIERSDDPKGKFPVDPDAPASVVYVIADRVERLDAYIPAMGSMSRDFH